MKSFAKADHIRDLISLFQNTAQQQRLSAVCKTSSALLSTAE
jgi:hypothetical protein